MEEKYNLKKESKEDIVKYLNEAPSRMYDANSARNNIDNCDCPGCPCCDPDTPWLWPVGAGVLAASTGILTITAAAELAAG